MKLILKVLPGLLILLLFSCKGQTQIESLNNNGIYAIGGANAKYHITTDRMDNFFERININEVALQMRESPDKINASDLVNLYKDYLKSDILEFNDAELTFLNDVFKDIYQSSTLQKLNLPDSIFLIKVAGSHYGNSVYYTRENCIIIPQNVLKTKNEKTFGGVMLHEIFHIYSRYNPTVQKALYNIIGFYPVDDIDFPKALSERMIYNPDGLDMNWSVTLEYDETPIFVSPIILSKSNPDFKQGLFPNFEFKLYELQEIKSGAYIVKCNKKGDSTLDQRKAMNAYYKKIGTNTGYIIHPDEVLADHFMMVIRGDKVNLNKRSFTGKNLEILEQITSILNQ